MLKLGLRRDTKEQNANIQIQVQVHHPIPIHERRCNQETEQNNKQTNNRIMNNELIATRDLSPNEMGELRNLLKSQLSISNDDDEEDAENLLDYAVDMIESGEDVGHVAEEVSSICYFVTISF